MGLTAFAVKEMGGAPFSCHITEYARTMIYSLPSYRVQEGHGASYLLKVTDTFKASIVTDPVRSVLDDDFSEQQVVDDDFKNALTTACNDDDEKARTAIFIVVQFKENLGNFSATLGQCTTFEYEGRKSHYIVDCIDAPAPSPDKRTKDINLVLSAVRAEFEETDALVKVFDRSCYMTSAGECVFKMEFSVSAAAKLVSSLSPLDLKAKSNAIQDLIARIESAVREDSTKKKLQNSHDFEKRLGELIEALQLDESRDDAYLRLWNLRLWNRVEEFGEAFRPRLQLSNNHNLADEKKHRNDIAHRGVNKIDWAVLRSLQKKTFLLLRQRL